MLRYTAPTMRPATLASLTLTFALTSLASAQAQAPSTRVELHCEAVYLPARSTWPRTVELEHNQRRLTAVRIDGLPVYTFNVQGNVIITALDNERIQIDVAQLSWRSDFRGLAQSQGRCERTTP